MDTMASSVPDVPEMLLAGREKQFWGQWMKSEMRDPSALTEADLNEYTRWLAQPGGTRNHHGSISRCRKRWGAE
jgi:hypothetical protein